MSSSQKLLSRSLQELNDNGTKGVSLPKGLVEEHGLEPGDEIRIDEIDREAGRITLRLVD